MSNKNAPLVRQQILPFDRSCALHNQRLRHSRPLADSRRYTVARLAASAPAIFEPDPDDPADYVDGKTPVRTVAADAPSAR